MAKSLHDETIALAAIIQFLKLVEKVAISGSIETDLLEIPVKSILSTNAETTESIFEGFNNLYDGLHLLATDILKDPSQKELIRYFLTIIHIEKKLSANPELLNMLATGIEHTKTQVKYFSSHTHENIISNLGELYSTTISTISPRVLIQGDQDILDNPRTVSIIRTLLLSAVRCAILWRQSGGKKYKIVFTRKKYVSTAKEIINNL